MGRQRIVVKIGSSSLTTPTGGLSDEKIAEHVGALSALKDQGHDLILITSGAVAAGYTALGYPSRPVTLQGKQAAAAVGQGLLMQRYADQFRHHGYLSAQLLLTRHDFSVQDQYTNAFNTMNELLKRNVIPIINENDSVAVEELTFGDNDRLSALVSGLMHADRLILLTDINGLYTGDPRKEPNARKIDFLPTISNEDIEAAGDAGSKVGTGGMRSKIEAAKVAQQLGVPTFIGTGSGPTKLLDILSGNGDGTYIGSAPTATSLKNTKQWIQLHSSISGQITVDQGAVSALLEKGRSLLPAGVLAVHGTFSEGQVVQVLTPDGHVIGKGKVTLSSDDLRRLKGRHSKDIQSHTHHHRPEVIHRDQWVSI